MAHGEDLGALAAAYVLLTAVGRPLVAKYADRLPGPGRVSPAPVSPRRA